MKPTLDISCEIQEIYSRLKNKHNTSAAVVFSPSSIRCVSREHIERFVSFSFPQNFEFFSTLFNLVAYQCINHTNYNLSCNLLLLVTPATLGGGYNKNSMKFKNLKGIGLKSPSVVPTETVFSQTWHYTWKGFLKQKGERQTRFIYP